MKINWKVRFQNPVFWIQIFLAVSTPLFGYFGLTAEDMITWNILFDTIKSALGNPHVLAVIAVSIWNAVIDPTSKGFCDKKEVLEQNEKEVN